MSLNGMRQVNTTMCEKHGCSKDVTTMSILGSTFTIASCSQCVTEEEAARIEKKNSQTNTVLSRGIPPRFKGAQLSDFTDIGQVTAWVKNPKGFLFIHGACGSGKSHLACAIKRNFNQQKKSCELSFCSDVFLKLRNTFNSKDSTELDAIKGYAPDDGVDGLGIFDDIGAQKISEYVIEAWYNIIDRRYMFEHPTLFTSNLSLKEISLCMGDRIASRLNSGIVYELKGPDRRFWRKQ